MTEDEESKKTFWDRVTDCMTVKQQRKSEEITDDDSSSIDSAGEEKDNGTTTQGSTTDENMKYELGDDPSQKTPTCPIKLQDPYSACCCEEKSDSIACVPKEVPPCNCDACQDKHFHKA